MTAKIAKSDANLLPHDEAAERSVIGSVLIDPDALLRAQEAGLKAADFWDMRLGWVYDAAESLSLRREPVELFSIARELERTRNGTDQDHLAVLGGDAALTRLISDTASTVNAGYYAESVKRDALRRRMIAAGAEVAAARHKHDGDIGELYDAVSQILFGAMERSESDSHLMGGSDTLRAYFDGQTERARLLAANKDALLKTYWHDVDRMIGNFQPGQLVSVGASTSVGKTMAMEQVAEANAKRGHAIAFYHLELSHQSMLDRCVARVSGIDTRRLREGYDGAEVFDALAEISVWHDNITLIHCPGWTAERIAADIMRLHAQGRCELAVVDYLGKLALPDRKGYTPSKLIGLQVDAFKNAAEQLAIPILLGSQVSRFFKQTATHRPTMDDLRDSGEIGEKANIVLMLHNPVAREDRDERASTETIELHVEKNTDGPLGKAELVHVKGRFLLGDMAQEHEPVPHYQERERVEQIPW